MLSIETVERVKSLAEKATMQGMTLLPCMDTPLSNLCNVTNVVLPGLIQDPAKQTKIEAIDDEMVRAYSEESNNTTHNHEIDTLITQLVNITSEHISFARNYVLDIVKRYVAAVTLDAKDYATDPISEFNIRQFAMPEPLHSDTIQNEIDKYASLSYHEPDIYPNFDSKGPVELTELIKTGNGALDRSIDKWIMVVGTDALIGIWDRFFTDYLVNTKAIAGEMELAFSNVVDGVNNALMVFLLARSVMNKKTEGARLSEAELKRCMTQYMDASGVALLRLRGIFEKDKDTLVLQVNRNEKTIFVNKTPYLEWLGKGGSNELILGAYVGGYSYNTTGAIDAKRDDIAKAWDSYKNVTRIQHSNALVNQYRNSLRTHFFAMLKDRNEQEDELFKNPNHLGKISELFEHEIAAVGTKEIKCLETVCYRIVCLARFPYTSAYAIIRDIDEVTSQNDQVSVNTGALAATINYVTDYIADQIRCQY